MKRVLFVLAIVILSILALILQFDETSVFALKYPLSDYRSDLSNIRTLNVVYSPIILNSSPDGTPSPVVNLPLVNNAAGGDQDNPSASNLDELPPLPCLGGILVILVVPLSLIVKLRSGFMP